MFPATLCTSSPPLMTLPFVKASTVSLFFKTTSTGSLSVFVREVSPSTTLKPSNASITLLLLVV
ncbi:hypothetical protein BY458DRAFT_509578, partial [Sporodiniella umbellata]